MYMSQYQYYIDKCMHIYTCAIYLNAAGPCNNHIGMMNKCVRSDEFSDDEKFSVPY